MGRRITALGVIIALALGLAWMAGVRPSPALRTKAFGYAASAEHTLETEVASLKKTLHFDAWAEVLGPRTQEEQGSDSSNSVGVASGAPSSDRLSLSNLARSAARHIESPPLKTLRTSATGHCRVLKPDAAYVKEMLYDADTKSSQRRVALVVGNGAYPGDLKLNNPPHDAPSMARALQALGFEVHLGVDLKGSELEACEKSFETAVRGADIALFYYSGHGAQIATTKAGNTTSRNYMVATNFSIDPTTHIAKGFYQIDPVLSAMRARVKPNTGQAVFLLDACRTNPFAGPVTIDGETGTIGTGAADIVIKKRQMLPTTPGTAPQSAKAAGAGLFIAYATAPNKTADDAWAQSSQHSPFTQALLDNIATPGLAIEQVMNRVFNEVANDTQHRQTPWISSSLTQSLRLNGDVAGSDLETQIRARTNDAANLRDEDEKFEAMATALSALPTHWTASTPRPYGYAMAELARDNAMTSWVIAHHSGPVNSAEFSPDGTRVVTASNDNTARIWDAKTGALITTIKHGDAVNSAAFSPDGTRVVTASSDGTAKISDAKTGALMATIKHGGPVLSAAFSPDGTRVVTASLDYTAKISDAKTGALIATIKHNDTVRSAAFSPDGTRVVTASEDGTAKISAAKTGALIATIKHDGLVNSATFSPDGTRVVTASSDGTAKISDARTGALIATIKHGDMVESAAFSPDGKRVVTACNDGTTKISNSKTGSLIATIKPDGPDSVVSAAFSPDGTRVVTAYVYGTAKISDARTGARIATVKHDDGRVNSATFSPDGTRVVTASTDGTVKISDARMGALIATIKHDDEDRSAAFSSDGTRVVTTSLDSTAKISDARTGALIATIKHNYTVNSAAFSPDGTRVVTASDDHTAKISNAKTGALIATIKHGDAVISAAFSPDGTRVATASLDYTAKISDAKTGALIATIKHDDPVISAAFSPDGTRVVTASEDGTAKISAAKTGALIATIEHDAQVNSAAFSPDGTRVVTASEDRTAKISDAKTGALIATIKHGGSVNSATFSPDGTRVVTASEYGTAKISDAKTGALIATIKYDLPVVSAAFSSDGTRVITASTDGTAKISKVGPYGQPLMNAAYAQLTDNLKRQVEKNRIRYWSVDPSKLR